PPPSPEEHVRRANIRALGIVGSILGAPAPTQLVIHGVPVQLSDQGSLPAPAWPKIPALSEADHGPWPTPRAWECTWEGGSVTLTLTASVSYPNYGPRGVGLKMAGNGAEVISLDVASYLRRPLADGANRVSAEF